MAEREINALESEGIEFMRGDGSGSYTGAAEVTDVGGLDGSTTVHNPTTLRDKWVRKKAGLADAGNVTLSLYFNPGLADQKSLRDDWRTKATRAYRIKFPDGSTIDFSGFITSFPFTGSVDQLITSDITIAVDGEPTFGDAGGA